MAAVPEHHHKHPRLAQSPLRWIPELPHVTEVDLGDLARPGHHGDRDVLGARATLTSNASHQSLDRANATAKVSVFASQAIVDCCRTEPIFVQPGNSLAAALQARLLLMR